MTRLTDTTWRPTRVGTLVVLLGTLAVSAALARPLGLEPSIVLAWTAAVPFALGLWLVERERWRPAARFLAGVAVLPLGVGATVGAVYAAVTLFGSLFPQPTAAQVAEATLVVLGRLAVVAGLTAAALGATVSVGDLADRASLRRFSKVAGRTAFVAIAAAGALVALAVVGHTEIGGLQGTVGDAASGVASALERELLAPDAGTPHVFSFAALVVLSSLTVAGALRSLPVAELLDAPASVTAVRRALYQVTLAGIVLLVAGTLTRFAISPARLRRVLPAAAYDALVAVTTLGVLRTALVAAAVAGLAGVLVGWLFRRLARASAGTAAVRHAPTVAGGALVAGTFAVHAPLVDELHGFVLSQVPYTVAGTVREQSGAILSYYGTFTAAAVLLAVVLVAATATLVAARVGVGLRILPVDTFGPALAAAGLFVAAAFAGTTDAVTPLRFLACVVAALVVWDAGEYATQLGDEIGRHVSTAGVEGVHLVGTLLVGVAAAALAVAVANYGTAMAFANPNALPVAVVGSGVALLALVFALK
ncbi:DUF7519 family protein [Salarchaeum japonicum]|uniref:Uncharacterized protein n=1 Tax=Salarchaeum japonicum TaxID=555573 RepID=A0AAV3T552_9EURY|nr:hypothetical protein [Salarchaeum japonicum]